MIESFAAGVACGGAAIWLICARYFYKAGMHKACDLIGTDYAHSPTLPIHPTLRLTVAIARCRHYADKL